MARLPFNSPYMLGFDELETMLEAIGKSGGEGFPPYNIEQIGPDVLRITLALAGYRLDDLDVEIEGRTLIIRGQGGDTPAPAGVERVFLHRGIAARQFMRKFLLAEGIEVADAMMEHGLLHIDLKRPKAEPRKVTVKIRE